MNAKNATASADIPPERPATSAALPFSPPFDTGVTVGCDPTNGVGLGVGLRVDVGAELGDPVGDELGAVEGNAVGSGVVGFAVVGAWVHEQDLCSKKPWRMKWFSSSAMLQGYPVFVHAS